MDLLIRFLVGGLVVSAFAVIGDLFKPKSFAGIFAAAPSVALATLGLTVLKQGSGYASIEARSMMLGAIALAVYSHSVTWLLVRLRVSSSSFIITTAAMALWLVLALGLGLLLS